MCYEADSVSVSASQQHCADNMNPHNPSLQRTADAAAEFDVILLNNQM